MVVTVPGQVRKVSKNTTVHIVLVYNDRASFIFSQIPFMLRCIQIHFFNM